MTKNLEKGLTPYGEVIAEYTEPGEKLRGRKYVIGLIFGSVLLLASASCIFYLRGESRPMIVTAVFAALVGVLGVRGLRAASGASNVTLTRKGIVFRSMPPDRRFVRYEEIASIRVGGVPKRLKLYKLTTLDRRKLRIDGWIEHDLLKRLKAQLGGRWEVVFTPRPGRYPIFPPRT